MRRPLPPEEQKPSKAKPKLAVVKAPEPPAPAQDPVLGVIEELNVQQQVLHLKTEGFNNTEIARKLGITTHRVTQALVTSLDEYYADRDGAVQRYLAVAQARYDRIFRTWMPLAEPRIEVVKNDDGVEMEIVHPPNAEAARVVLTAMRDLAKIMGLNKLRVEHTGKDGESININVDWNTLTDEQLRKFTETGDTGFLRALSGALASASGAGVASATGTT